MIRFPCRCGQRFELPDEEAGGMIQCPKCGLLNDVPSLDDLRTFNDEGIYEVSVDRPTGSPERIAQLGLMYGAGTRDIEGDEIDLRISMNELEGEVDPRTGAIPLVPLAPDKPTDPVSRPRYDPETGERVIPLDIKRTGGEPVDPSEIPVAKRAPALSYASVATDGILPRRMMLDLLMPASLIVLFIVFVVQVGYQMISLFLARILSIFGVPPEIVLLPLVILLLGHYSNVVQDTGPFEHDEIQRPLRDIGLLDDLFLPFASAVCALLLCYFPMLLAIRFSPPELLSVSVTSMWLLGSIPYPAVLLTILTSGSYLDLTPTRIFGVIRESGRQYWLSVGTWLFVGPLLVITVLGPRLPAILFPKLMIFGEPALYIPALAVTIYFAHFFHWHLGLIYRANSARFPWVLQEMIMGRPRIIKPGEAVTANSEPKIGRSTRDKLRDLREAERRRQSEKTMVDREVERTRHPGPWLT